LSHTEYNNGEWKMTATVLDKIDKKKDLIRDISAPKVITSEAQHDRYVSALLELERLERRGLIGDDGKALMELLVLLVEKYEDETVEIPNASPLEVLRELMAANDLRQKDLAPELGTESIVSEVLNGKRELNKVHIERLSRRFHVSPAVFFSNKPRERRAVARSR
jgi:HTH-type transcriptional regulator / antitoxin HigA